MDRDKGTDQWQREAERFIPYPASWLNQQIAPLCRNLDLTQQQLPG